MKPNKVFVACALLFLFFTTYTARAAEFPRAQLDESERFFTRAYSYFLARDYWNASDFLERALNANIYLVDYYLLKGLTMNRLGDFNAGRGAFVHYLEVRPMDMTASRILSYSIEQQRNLRAALGLSTLSVRWRTSLPDLQTELGLGFIRPFNVQGLGKVRSSPFSLLLADTLGDRIFFRKNTMRGVQTLAVEKPVVALPMGDNSFNVFTASGDVHFFSAETDEPGLLSLDIKGTLEGDNDMDITDAVLLAAQDIAVSDRIGRRVAFHSLFDLSLLAEWAPPDNEQLFEPVALASYGPWLAVADRGNNKIYFLNMLNRRDVFDVELSLPRDIVWSSLGELMVINEDGDVFRVMPDFQAKHAESDLLMSGFSNGWAFFSSPLGEIYCIDISASRLLRLTMGPDPAISWNFFSIFSPKIEKQPDGESIVVQATFMSPYSAYSRTRPMVSHAVWNNRAMTALTSWNESIGRNTGILLFNRRAPDGLINSSLESMVVANGTDLQIALPAVWNAKRENLTNILIDASLSFSRDEIEVLTLFCLNNGIQLDLWARSFPSIELARASALTGGKTVFSVAHMPELSPPFSRMQLRIPLPPELSSSGFPSRSMLVVFLDIGLMYTRDWIPLWPDLLN